MDEIPIFCVISAFQAFVILLFFVQKSLLNDRKNGKIREKPPSSPN